MESTFEKMARQDDLSYTNFGNKRVNKQDYKIYKESLNPDATWQKEGYIPNDAAENMRRLSGPDAGMLTGSNFVSNRLINPDNKKTNTQILQQIS